MRIQVMLNKVYRHKSFVYGKASFFEHDGREALKVEMHARKNSRPICSGCNRKRPGYDSLQPRLFEFVPFWGFVVFLVYALRRVDCPNCGVVVESVPWACGKHRMTEAYGWFLAQWARRLSWSETAEAFRTSYHHVYCSVQMAVEWGRERMDLNGISAIGVDEIQWSRGHHYLTLVYQIDASRRRLLWIGQDRTARTLLGFFRWLGGDRTAEIRFVCSDMWKPYLKVIAKKLPQAIHILDRFHIVAHMNKAIDKVRAEEARKMKAAGQEPLLKKSRWCFLKRSKNLTTGQRGRLRTLLQYNLRTVRAYLLKEDFNNFWEYKSPYWAGEFLDSWCYYTMRSQIEPMKKIARMLRKHRPLILNWFRAKKRFSSGIVEGLNAKAKLTMRKAYGYSEANTVKIALYHTLGELPTPEIAHRFF